MTPPSPGPRSLSGRRVVAAGLAGGAMALAIALFLRTIVATTTARLSPEALFWSTVLLGGFGMVAGMAVAAVRQLQLSNPDPEYHRSPALRPRGPRGRKRRS